MISSNLHHLHNKCNHQAEFKISATSALQINHKFNLKVCFLFRKKPSKYILSINLSQLRQNTHSCSKGMQTDVIKQLLCVYDFFLSSSDLQVYADLETSDFLPDGSGVDIFYKQQISRMHRIFVEISKVILCT